MIMRALNGIGRQKRRARGTVTLERCSESRYTAALEMEDGAMSQAEQVASVSWKRHSPDPPLSPHKEHSPGHLPQASDPPNCKEIFVLS